MDNEKKVKISDYKGNPVITLNPDDRYPFTFGVNKAKLILEHLEDIKDFVEKYKKEDKAEN